VSDKDLFLLDRQVLGTGDENQVACGDGSAGYGASHLPGHVDTLSDAVDEAVEPLVRVRQ
jgi:hypothetical protein